jgi:hypothetical protein
MTVLNAQGATFTIDDDSSTPVTVGGIVSFTGFDGEASDIDVTTLASTAKEFRQGLQDFGNFSIDLMRDPQDLGQIELEDAKENADIRTCILTLPSGDIATFEAYVKSVSAAGGVDAVVTGTANMKITGSVVWTN